MKTAKTLVQSQFGANAEKYATSRVHAEGESLARLLELTRPQPHWRVLDIATGAGHTALAFAPHVEHVVASDLTPEMLDIARDLARKRGLGNIAFAEAAAENLPFNDAAFDLVTCRIAPHHFADVQRFVGEVARVLRPGGIFGLADNISPDDAEAAKRYNAIEKLRDPSHGRCLAVAEWERLLRGAGFDIDHTEVLTKEIEFEGWAGRMQTPQEFRTKLKAMLWDDAAHMQAFLRTREQAGQICFTIAEIVTAARRP